MLRTVGFRHEGLWARRVSDFGGWGSGLSDLGVWGVRLKPPKPETASARTAFLEKVF